jgi:hypothetical protein
MENRDYKTLLKELYDKDDGSVYQKLMQKEYTVLDTVNRAINQVKEDKNTNEQFINMPVIAIGERFYTSMKTIFNDLQNVKSYKGIYNIINMEDRIIYIGLLLILIALFLLLIQGDP